MATLYRIDLSKAHLDQIPRDERTFYLMVSQLGNDLNVLAKLLWFASNRPSADAIRGRVGTAQELLIIKMLAGRLYEGRDLLNKAFSAKGLWDKYKDALPPNARESFENINRYFGRENVVKTIRKKFAFHFDVPVMEAMYERVPSEAPFVDFLGSEYSGHNLYYSGEALSINAVIAVTGETDWRDALMKIFGETTQVSVWFGFFIQGFVGLMLSRYVGITMEDCVARSVTVADDPPIDEVRLPFFCPPPKSRD